MNESDRLLALFPPHCTTPLPCWKVAVAVAEAGLRIDLGDSVYLAEQERLVPIAEDIGRSCMTGVTIGNEPYERTCGF